MERVDVGGLEGDCGSVVLRPHWPTLSRQFLALVLFGSSFFVRRGRPLRLDWRSSLRHSGILVVIVGKETSSLFLRTPSGVSIVFP